MTTFSTNGYGDFTSQNEAEVIWSICYMMWNLGLSAYILGASVAFTFADPVARASVVEPDVMCPPHAATPCVRMSVLAARRASLNNILPGTGSITLVVINTDKRIGRYRTQCNHLEEYSETNELPQVRP